MIEIIEEEKPDTIINVKEKEMFQKSIVINLRQLKKYYMKKEIF